MKFLDKWNEIKTELQMEFIKKIRVAIDSDYEYARWVSRDIEENKK